MASAQVGPYLLGIDYGTESCRVAIFTADGTPVAFASTGYPTSHPRSGWAEQDPADWYRALVRSTRTAMERPGVAPEEIAGIGFAATSATVVALDANHEPLRPAIMWMDVRAAAQAGRAASPEARQALAGMVDNVPDSAELFPFKAAWLAEHEPETFRRTAMLLDAADWLGHKLTGEYRINENSASSKMYHNRSVGGFPRGFYEVVGAGEAFQKMPEMVLPLGAPLGRLTAQASADLGLRAGTPVAEGCIDAYAGQIGLNVLEPGRMALITGSSHVLLGQAPAATARSGLVGTFMDAVVPGQCSVEAAMVSSGSAVRWFRDTFAGDLVHAAEEQGLAAYDLLNQVAQGLPPGSEGLIVAPHFQGSRNPFADSHARAVIWGLSLRHTRAHVYHALQEGICYGVAHNLRNMADHGYEVEHLVACGGALRSRTWMQMHADVTGVPITLTKVPDAVSLGACVMAAAGAGLYPSVVAAAAAMVHEAETLQPDPQRHADYAWFVDAYVETYPRLQDLQRAMGEHLDGAASEAVSAGQDVRPESGTR
ncbi:MAG TPA: FGGY family carbohydrate kinase [Propionicimonas sp.]|nr:FGGY family carbohydrate kinase [Propionicimonas sp.]HRA06825.1 FGGY family carbohydrate kinase [Propionicimonas sp.]